MSSPNISSRRVKVEFGIAYYPLEIFNGEPRAIDPGSVHYERVLTATAWAIDRGFHYAEAQAEIAVEGGDGHGGAGRGVGEGIIGWRGFWTLVADACRNLSNYLDRIEADPAAKNVWSKPCLYDLDPAVKALAVDEPRRVSAKGNVPGYDYRISVPLEALAESAPPHSPPPLDPGPTLDDIMDFLCHIDERLDDIEAMLTTSNGETVQ